MRAAETKGVVRWENGVPKDLMEERGKERMYKNGKRRKKRS